jgi:RNA polymerase sigma-70 factor (ECF subfamily)
MDTTKAGPPVTKPAARKAKGCTVDDDSFASEIGTLMPILRRIAIHKTRGCHPREAAAEDLQHDTLERAWAKRHLFEPGTDLLAWLVTLMDRIRKSQRRVKARQILADALPLDECHRQDLGFEARVHAKLCLEDLHTRFKDVSPEDYVLLAQIKGAELSYNEIAKLTGMPSGTIGSRVSRALDKLRREHRRLLDGEDG